MVRVKITNIEQLPDILSPQQIADFVGIARQRVYDACQSRELRSFTIGASRKIDKRDMLEWIDSHRKNGSAESA